MNERSELDDILRSLKRYQQVSLFTEFLGSKFFEPRLLISKVSHISERSELSLVLENPLQKLKNIWNSGFLAISNMKESQRKNFQRLKKNQQSVFKNTYSFNACQQCS